MLREDHWADRSITQGQLAAALGVSVPLISSWESAHSPKVPPVARLASYATFFATERSIAREPFRVLDTSELTDAERAVRDELLTELTELREEAMQERRLPRRPVSPVGVDGPAAGLWDFPDDQDVTIVCGKLPRELRETMPYSNPDNPDYVELYSYSDPDALIELHGHIRATNPTRQVNFTASALTPDDYTTHLVLLGGVDWNPVTRDLLDRVDIPIRQAERFDETSDYGCFEVIDGEVSRSFSPIVKKVSDRSFLVEDVAFFYRGPSPYNANRTVTIFNGMFARGTLGAVRAVTDVKFRNQNETYLREQLAGKRAYSIITRVAVANGKVVTPNWVVPEARLHEWSEGMG